MSTKDKDVRRYVVGLLESYPETQRKIALLRYELEHPTTVSAEEMIDIMSFSRTDNLGQCTGSVSNKTLYIAMNYQAEAAKLNSDMADGIVQRLIPLENEIGRLHYYVSLLEPRFEQVIRMFYFEKKPWDEVASSLGCAVRTAQYFRKQAVKKLIETYQFVQGEL